MIADRLTTADAVRQLLRERWESARAGRRRLTRKSLPAPIRRIGRGVLEGLYRRWVHRVYAATRLLGTSRIVRPVDDFRGVFEMDLRSDVARQILYRDFEASYLSVFRESLRPGQDFIDVGANIGLYTVLGGRLVEGGKILAVEPAPSVLPLLHANLARNQVKNVFVFEGVASDRRGSFTLNSIVGNEEYSSLGTIVHPNAPSQSSRQFDVDGETLDELAERHDIRPALIKIDVEGGEAAVLRGAGGLLEQQRPIVLSELDHRMLSQFRDRPATVRDLLIRANYEIYDVSTGEHLSDSPLEDYRGEVVALPRP